MMDSFNIYEVMFFTFGITLAAGALLLINFVGSPKPKSTSEWCQLAIFNASAVLPLSWLIIELIDSARPVSDTLLVSVTALYALGCVAGYAQLRAEDDAMEEELALYMASRRAGSA